MRFIKSFKKGNDQHNICQDYELEMPCGHEDVILSPLDDYKNSFNSKLQVRNN